MKRAAVLAFLLVLPSCRCREVIDPSQPGFRAETTELDFGRVLEGNTVALDATVVGTGRPDLDVNLETDPPFAVAAVVRVPGGASTKFSVEFHAGSGPVTGEVRLSANAATARVKLKGVGVRPKICVPSAPCKLSIYSLELDSCVESLAMDGSGCQPNSVCLEKGECRAGLCQGTARTCDDLDACTIDSCSMDIGCIHLSRSCPSPTAACRVSTCDATSGCGEATAADGTPCGTVDCSSAHLCVAGGCVTVPTPEGFLCGPPTPCQGESHCHSQQCVAPDPGVMQPKTVVRLIGTPVDERPALLSQAGNVFFQLCGLAPLPDAGTDGGADAGQDAGADAGSDAGDDGGVDAGTSDGGLCALVSYTGTGFERWTARYQDSAPRRLIHVSPRGAVLLEPAALEVRLISTGAPTVLSLGGEAVARGVAQGADLELWAVVTGDGGSRLLRWGDGGALPAVPLDAGVSLLAVDEAGAAWVSSPDGGLLGFLQAAGDGGWSLKWRSAAAGINSVTACQQTVFTGGRTLFVSDGGAIWFPWLSDAGFPVELVERPILAGEGAGVAFYRECISPLMSCPEADQATWVQAFSLVDGQFLWRAKVLEEGTAARLEEVALTGIRPGALAALIQQSLDGGTQASLQAFAEGKRVLNCPLPEGTVLAGAVFTGSNLHALVNRDGGWLLETYDLAAMPLMTGGWPQADGISGTRRAR